MTDAKLRLEALKWEMVMANDITLEQRDEIEERLSESIVKKLQDGLLPQLEDTGDASQSWAVSLVLLQHFTDEEQFTKYVAEKAESCSNVPSAVVTVISEKAPGLRRDYLEREVSKAVEEASKEEEKTAEEIDKIYKLSRDIYKYFENNLKDIISRADKPAWLSIRMRKAQERIQKAAHDVEEREEKDEEEEKGAKNELTVQSSKQEEKAANADQTSDAQPVPDEVAASEHKEAELSPSKDQKTAQSELLSLAMYV